MLSIQRSVRRFTFVLLLVFCFGGLAAQHNDSSGSEPQGTWIIAVTIHDRTIDLRKIRALDLDIAGVDRKRNVVEILGDADDFNRMEDAGLDIEFDRPLPDEPGFNALSDYLNPVEVTAILDDAVLNYPALAKKVQYATTLEGRPTWALKISDNVNSEEDEPVVFIVSQHHAREVMTPEITTDIVNQLLENYGTDPELTRLVDEREIWILPNHNPDGASYVFTANSNWRKNRRDNGDGSFGVDPNRNYPFGWNSCNGSDGNPSSDTYRGTAPASEPITSDGITVLAREHRPWINLSYHTYSQLVIHPFGCEDTYSSENSTFRDFASQIGTRIDGDTAGTWYAPGTGWELLYSVDGEMNDWFYGELGSYGVTIEANSSTQGFRPDYATWRDITVQRNRAGWRQLLERADESGISGNVVDACTDAPLAATTRLESVVYANGEFPRTAEPLFGRYYWMTLPGDFSMRFEHTGYTTQILPVSVAYDRVELDTGLVPNGSFGATAIEWIIDDSLEGDGDGEADPGEIFNLTVRLLGAGGSLTNLQGSLSSSDLHVTILDGASAYGSLAAGATADGDGFRVQLDPSTADDTDIDFSIQLTADQTLCGSAKSFSLRSTTGIQACPMEGDTFDTDPGWTIVNSGSGGWEFGVPAGNGGSTGPNTAFTGANVYATNLAGSYGSNGDFTLTTGSYDLRGLRHTDLNFAEWLDNESGYDRSMVEISIDGGTNWTEAWSGFDYGDGWQIRQIDISSLVDQEQDVRFRFNLVSDANTVGAGWALDDFKICGESVPNSAGKLSYISHTIDDSPGAGGNGNGSIDVDETITMSVRVNSNRDTLSTGVEAFLTTTTPGVRIRNGYATLPDAPIGGTSDTNAPHFSYQITSATCADRIQFQLDTRWDSGSAISQFEIPIGATATSIVLDDDLETDLGWSVGGDATGGAWVLADPNGVNDNGGAPLQPEDDTTPTPGVQAWVTGNPKTQGNFDPGDGDVDSGTTWVESPLIDGTSADRLTLDYQRWFARRNPGQFDSSLFRVSVSNDDGFSWTTVDTTESDNAFWAPITTELLSVIAATPTMRIRFEAVEDLGGGLGDTLVEAAVDDLQIERERLECSPYTPPPGQAPNIVGNTLSVDRSGNHVRLDWQPPAVDGSHDAATGYRVYRSASADAGFSILSWPGANFELFADAMFDPRTDYYLVVSENTGGTSGDEPAP